MLLLLASLALAGQGAADAGGAHDVGAEMPADTRNPGSRYGFWLYTHLGSTWSNSPAVTWEVELLLRSAAAVSQAAFDAQVASTPMATWYAGRSNADQAMIRLAILRSP